MKNKWYKLLYIRDGRQYLLLSLFGLVLISYFGFHIPILIKELAELYKSNQFISKLYSLGIIFILIYLTKIFYGLSIMKYTTLMMQQIRSNVYSRWLEFPDMIIEGDNKRREYPQGEIMARIMSDSEALRDLVTSGTLNIFIELVLVISCFLSFMNIHFQLGVILAILEILVVVLFLIGSKKMRKSFLRVRQTRGQLSHIVSNSMGGINELFFNVHNNYILKRSKVVFQKYLKDILDSIVWDASYYSFSESIVPIFLVIIVFLIPYAHITEAALILTIVDLIQRSIRPIKSIASQIGNVQRAYGGVYRVNEILEDLTLDNSPNESQLLEKVENIEVFIKKFSYSSRKIEDELIPFSLSQIELNLKKGHKYAFVGLSGCGKSTLLNIISGSILPKKFYIKLNERLINQKNFAKINWYRKHVGLISQDSHIFTNFLYFNLSFENSISKELHDFWKKITLKIPYLLEWGISLETVISIDEMSLGQKQLIAALRSLYLKKEIVLFDEISSSLDSSLEKSLSEVISLISKNSITIFVAHRLETIMKCDQIYVMNNGQIIDTGKHKTLEKESVLYKNFLKELSDANL